MEEMRESSWKVPVALIVFRKITRYEFGATFSGFPIHFKMGIA